MAGRMARRLLMSLAALAALTLAACGPSATKESTDGSTMILIPAGSFQMGGSEEEVAGQPDSQLLTYHAERPIRTVTLDAFYIDKHEITNAQYAEFLEAAQGSSQWDHPDQPTDRGHEQRYLTDDLRGADQPAVGINWFDAYAYCQWAGKRLPTEAEWEYAARGAEGRRVYPWGDAAPDADGIWWANYRPVSGPASDGHRHTAPVGSYPDGVSPFGVMDMAGNAEEWVQDWYSVNYYRHTAEGATNPTGPLTGGKRVIKGGSYEAPVHQIRVAMRLFGRPQDKGPRLGVRCAQTP
jgi:sulfatase modifying factor 1